MPVHVTILRTFTRFVPTPTYTPFTPTLRYVHLPHTAHVRFPFSLRFHAHRTPPYCPVLDSSALVGTLTDLQVDSRLRSVTRVIRVDATHYCLRLPRMPFCTPPLPSPPFHRYRFYLSTYLPTVIFLPLRVALPFRLVTHRLLRSRSHIHTHTPTPTLRVLPPLPATPDLPRSLPLPTTLPVCYLISYCLPCLPARISCLLPPRSHRTRFCAHNVWLVRFVRLDAAARTAPPAHARGSSGSYTYYMDLSALPRPPHGSFLYCLSFTPALPATARTTHRYLPGSSLPTAPSPPLRTGYTFLHGYPRCLHTSRRMLRRLPRLRTPRTAAPGLLPQHVAVRRCTFTPHCTAFWVRHLRTRTAHSAHHAHLSATSFTRCADYLRCSAHTTHLCLAHTLLHSYRLWFTHLCLHATLFSAVSPPPLRSTRSACLRLRHTAAYWVALHIAAPLSAPRLCLLLRYITSSSRLTLLPPLLPFCTHRLAARAARSLGSSLPHYRAYAYT